MKYQLHTIELVSVGANSFRLTRAAVPGGWLYCMSSNDGEALTFVPDPTVEIEQ